MPAEKSVDLEPQQSKLERQESKQDHLDVKQEHLDDKLERPDDNLERPDDKLERLDDKLAESYDVLGLLGSGGMGSVYKARHKVLGHLVAIKRASGDANAAVVERFVNEAKAASRLKHENVAGIREFGVDSDGRPYAVMDYAEGESLSSLISKKQTGDPRRVIDIAIQLCHGLEHAHENGVVHRDIKPSNIMIKTREDGKDLAVIVDFGIAKVDDQRLTATGDVLGSPFYLSTEQASGLVVDKRTDIYSLGCVIYECLVGSPPYTGDSPIQTAMKHINAPIPELKDTCKIPVPSGLTDVVRTCLQKDPEKRYRSTADLEQALKAVLQGKTPRAASSAGQKRTIKIVLCTSFLLFIIMTIFLEKNNFVATLTAQASDRSVDSFKEEKLDDAVFHGKFATFLIELLPEQYEELKSQVRNRLKGFTHIKTAQTQMSQQQYDAAAKTCNQLLNAKTPKKWQFARPILLNIKGQIMLTKGHLERAKENFAAAAEDVKLNNAQIIPVYREALVQSLVNLAQVAVKQNNATLAIQYARQASFIVDPKKTAEKQMISSLVAEILAKTQMPSTTPPVQAPSKTK